MRGPRESHICPGCACLCDDLDLSGADVPLEAVLNVCAWGSARFFGAKKFHPGQPRRRLQAPRVRRRGRWEEVGYAAALEVAAQVLSRARRPVVFGLSGCGSRAQAAALQLARRLKARLEPADLGFLAPYYQALSGQEIFWASLDYLRDEADTVVYWGANPLHSCPRHLVRYAVFPRGRFTERGAEDRRLAAVDVHRTEMARLCQLFLTVSPGGDLELITAVHARVTGAAGAGEVRGARRLAEFLLKGDCGVIFAGRGLAYGEGAAARFAALADLTRVLSRRGRFFLFPLATDFNSAGLYHLLLTELGSPLAPDFGAGGEPAFSARPVDWAAVDAVLVTGADLLWHLPEETRRELARRRVPLVTVGPWEDRTAGQALVALPAALEGIEADELAYRMDGLPLILRGVLPQAAPAAHEVLTDLLTTLSSEVIHDRGQTGLPHRGSGNHHGDHQTGAVAR